MRSPAHYNERIQSWHSWLESHPEATPQHRDLVARLIAMYTAVIPEAEVAMDRLRSIPKAAT